MANGGERTTQQAALNAKHEVRSARIGRLRREKEFARVYRKGRSCAHPLLVLKALPGEVGVTRYGFAVGKRLGKAVVRNRVKRRLREAARLTPVVSGWHIILAARPPAAGASYHELKATLEQLLRRARLNGSASPPPAPFSAGAGTSALHSESAGPAKSTTDDS